MAETSITGVIEEIFDEVEVTPTFKKLDFVVRYYQNGNQAYPEYILFQLHGGMTQIMDNFNIGDSVTVWFNFKGKPWVNRQGIRTWWNTLKAWKVEHDNWDSQAGKMPASKEDWATAKGTGAQQSFYNSNQAADDDDLPF